MAENPSYRMIYVSLDDIGSVIAGYQVTQEETSFCIRFPRKVHGDFTGEATSAIASFNPGYRELLAHDSLASAVELASVNRQRAEDEERQLPGDGPNKSKANAKAHLLRAERMDKLKRVEMFHRSLLMSPDGWPIQPRESGLIVRCERGNSLTFEDMIAPVIELIKSSGNAFPINIDMPAVMKAYLARGISPEKASYLRSQLRSELTNLVHPYCRPSTTGQVGEGTVCLNQKGLKEFVDHVMALRSMNPVLYRFDANGVDLDRGVGIMDSVDSWQ